MVTNVLAQTPTPSPTPSQSSNWFGLTEGQVPYWVTLLIALLVYLARPLVEMGGNRLLLWFRGLGKVGHFQQHYLTWLIGQCRYLPMIQPNVVAARWEYQWRTIKLEELYTPLSLGTVERQFEQREKWFDKYERVGKFSDWLRKQWHRLRPPHVPQAGDIGALLQQQPHLVVLGDPGSGKTTLLRYLALTAARSLRNKRLDGDDKRLGYQRFGWSKRPFPILIPLNLLADVTTWAEEKPLLDEIVATLPGDLQAHAPADFFEKRLRRGNCLVLFDGFDELGSREARSTMAKKIAGLANTYNHPANRYLVSSRIVGYENQLNTYGFQVRTVADLDDASIRLLIQRSYQAIALGESIGRSKQEEVELHAKYQARAQLLIDNLGRNQGLRTLAPNPLLLSLIVLVHMVKIELPEQRHLLYRDCVEILTERWEAVRSDMTGHMSIKAVEDLDLSQKIELLRKLALHMQKQRRPGGEQILLPRHELEAMIADHLPSLISSQLAAEPEKRQQECAQKARDLLENIRHKSGILTEKGHNSVGDPVVGFSHLTFLEYLAADAIRQQPDELLHLTRNLFHAAWRETLLLYVGMGNAAPVMQAALEDSTHTTHTTLTRLLLAGRCLTEKITLEPTLQRQILHGLSAYFLPPTAPPFGAIGALISLLGNEQRYDWLLENLDDLLTVEERRALLQPLEQLTVGSSYQPIQQILLRTMHHGEDLNARQQLGSILGAIGDPRDLDELVTVPAGKFTMGGDGEYDGKPSHEVMLDAYQIAKYPVTNAQYHQFVLATGHRPARDWPAGQPEPRKLNHPVVGISWRDANQYCAWLSQETGQPFRLPTEAEWEKAARGDQDTRAYPWGDAPPTAQLCNFEMKIGDTTPVGLYPAGASPYGCLDLAGNVWEWTSSLYKDYPYDPTDGRENPDDGGRRTLRGGAFVFNANYVRCAYRYDFEPDNWFYGFGFRVMSPGAFGR